MSILSAEEAAWKICRIEGKTTIKGGKTQLNLHDGRNIIVEDAQAYSTGDSLKLGLPEQNVLEKAPDATSSVAATWVPRLM